MGGTRPKKRLNRWGPPWGLPEAHPRAFWKNVLEKCFGREPSESRPSWSRPRWSRPSWGCPSWSRPSWSRRFGDDLRGSWVFRFLYQPQFWEVTGCEKYTKTKAFSQFFLPRRDLPSAPREMDNGPFLMVSGGGQRRKDQGKHMFLKHFSSKTRST